MTPVFTPVATSKERWPRGLDLPRHRHETGYVCLVLSGSIDEAGDRGRRIARAGDVNCHGHFDAHRDWFRVNDAETLNFALPDLAEPAHAFCRVQNPDVIARMAESDYEAARALLFSSLEPVRCPASDWPDELALDIQRDPRLCLMEWADSRGINPASISRGFARIYQITPKAYRAHARARSAWQSIVSTSLPLAGIAVDGGFADQAHMTRAVTLLTGRTPSHWRRRGKVDSRRGHASAAGLANEKTRAAFFDWSANHTDRARNPWLLSRGG